MLIGVVVAVGVVCWVLYRADQDSKKHRAEMLAVRTYENERNFRLHLIQGGKTLPRNSPGYSRDWPGRGRLKARRPAILDE